MRKKTPYPNGAKFAFTTLDDTDDTTVENGKPVYDLLGQLGIFTTKTVWSFDTDKENQGPYFAGETLQSPAYLEWVHSLKDSGFEIAFHNATMGTSQRGDTIKALDFLEKEFGQKIRLHCNHGQNKENLFWGKDRYNNIILKLAYTLLTKVKDYPVFEGDKKGTPYYWLDIADERLSYIRGFAYTRLNGEKLSPGKPYQGKINNFKPLFFNTADAPDINTFNKLVTPASINRLKQQGGWAIVSTHFGKGFYANERLNREFKKNMEYLSEQGGWYVPVTTLLDFLVQKRGVAHVKTGGWFLMELGHVFDRVFAK